MSIYLAKKKLKNILNNGILNYDINMEKIKHVAEVPSKGILDYQDYNEENLKNLVKKNKTVYVDIEFWNYNYCQYKNINPIITENILEQFDFLPNDYKSFSEGNIVILILLHELLTNIFIIPKLEDFKLYLEKLKISNKIIVNFLTRIEYKLPLTENYLYLILKVFNEENIYDFLFRECCYFTIDEYKIILEKFKIKDIHLLSYYIKSHFNNSKKFLEYLDFIIDIYDKKIDLTNTIVFKLKNNNYNLGYYLLTLDINNEIENLYYKVIKKYLDKEGALNIKVYDNHKVSKLIKTRKLEIENYFNRY